MKTTTRYVAFEGVRRLALGPLAEVAAAVKPAVDQQQARVLVLDADTAEQVELDLRGTMDEVLGRLPAPEPQDEALVEPVPEIRGRGRPRLGVVAREVTLLPRHWDWLATQRGGSSAALRRLVEQARKANEAGDRLRVGRDALYRFLSVMAGDAEGFEEAARALFAGDRERFVARTAAFPPDVRAHALDMARAAFVSP